MLNVLLWSEGQWKRCFKQNPLGVCSEIRLFYEAEISFIFSSLIKQEFLSALKYEESNWESCSWGKFHVESDGFQKAHGARDETSGWWLFEDVNDTASCGYWKWSRSRQVSILTFQVGFHWKHRSVVLEMSLLGNFDFVFFWKSDRIPSWLLSKFRKRIFCKQPHIFSVA